MMLLTEINLAYYQDFRMTSAMPSRRAALPIFATRPRRLGEPARLARQLRLRSRDPDGPDEQTHRLNGGDAIHLSRISRGGGVATR